MAESGESKSYPPPVRDEKTGRIISGCLNPAGRSNHTWRSRLEKAVNVRLDADRAEKIAERVLGKAEQGDMEATKLVMGAVFAKRLELTGEDGDAIALKMQSLADAAILQRERRANGHDREAVTEERQGDT